MLLVNVLAILGSICMIVSKPLNTYITILIGRFIAGFVTGMFSGIGPMYLSEIPPRNYIGASGVLNQLTIVIGLLVTNILGLPQLLGTDKLWPYLVGFTLVPAISLYIASPFMVESPKFVYNKTADVHKTRESNKLW